MATPPPGYFDRLTKEDIERLLDAPFYSTPDTVFESLMSTGTATYTTEFHVLTGNIFHRDAQGDVITLAPSQYRRIK